MNGFANEPCTVLIISDELAFWKISRPHNCANQPFVGRMLPECRIFGNHY
jgi:hypothetical protein